MLHTSFAASLTAAGAGASFFTVCSARLMTWRKVAEGTAIQRQAVAMPRTQSRKAWVGHHPGGEPADPPAECILLSLQDGELLEVVRLGQYFGVPPPPACHITYILLPGVRYGTWNRCSCGSVLSRPTATVRYRGRSCGAIRPGMHSFTELLLAGMVGPWAPCQAISFT